MTVRPVLLPRALAALVLAALAGLWACDAPSGRRRVVANPGPDERPARVELVVADDSAPAPLVDSGAVDSIAAERATWPTTVIRFTAVEAAPVRMWTGDTLRLPSPEPPAGTPPDIARDLRWSSHDPGIATVSGDGVVVAQRPGTASIVAWRRVGQVATPVTVLPAVRGRILAADGGPDGLPDGLALDAIVVIRSDAGLPDTARTNVAGRFMWRASQLTGRGVDVAVIPYGPTESRYFAARTGRVPEEDMARVGVVLIPRRWRVEGGSYGGTTIDVDPAAALARLRDGSRFWRLSRTNRAGATGRPVGWAADRLPIPVALDPDLGDDAVRRADSIAFWAAARQLERDWGAPLFAPAPAAGARRGDWAGIAVQIDPRIPADGFTTTTSDSNGDVYVADVAFRTRAHLRDPGIVTHELMHALGLGHTDRQESVMRARGTLPARASADDIAYGRLLYAVRRIQARWDAEFGLGEIVVPTR